MARERAEAMAIVTMAAFRRGCGLGGMGATAAGIEQMRDGVGAWRATGAELESTYRLAEIAKACAEIGDLEAGFEAVTEALALAGQHSERFHEADRHRLRGELFLLRAAQDSRNTAGHPRVPREAVAQAVGRFRQAVGVAR